MYWIWDNLGTCALTESCTPEGVVIVDVRDLLDNNKADLEAVKMRITLVQNLMSAGFKVCVRCIAGMSRSNLIACAAMTAFSFHDWDYCWDQVKKKCPRANENTGFIEVVKKALLESGVDRKRLYYE